MKNRVQIRKDAAPAADTVTRLHDMEVQEVSLVDRAANKRTFLVVKRDTGELGGGTNVELAPDGKGGFVPVQKDAPTADAHPAVPAPPPPAGAKQPPAAPPAAGAKPPLSISADAKAAMEAGLHAAVTQLTAYLTQLQGTQPDPAAQGAPPEAQQALQAVAESLMTLGGAKGPPAPPGTPAKAPPSTQGAAAAAADAGKETAKSMSGELQKSIDGIRSDLEKVGAKMSKDRLSRFTEAVSKLQDVLKELVGIEAEGVDKALPPPPAPGKRPVPAAAMAPTPALKSDLSPEATAAIQALEKQVGELTTITKRQGEELQVVEQLRKRVGGSNAIPVESDRIATQKGRDDVIWPRDMNDRPASKRPTPKGETFLDDK